MDRELHDARENGTLDVPHLLAVSSNIGMSRIFDALGGDALARWLHRFHFDEAPPVPGAAHGAYPEQIVTGTMEGATVAIGHRVMVTPLQMIAAYGAIAADGVYHAPTLDRGGSPGERLLSPEAARSVLSMLETVVVDETGTGHAARVDGVRVAGKTGTADALVPDSLGTTYASFIGVADLPSRRLVALVGIEAATRDGLTGGAAAAPVFARLVARLR